jgi:Nitrile hydratase, alpha chain
MPVPCNRTMGGVIATAWSDAAFKALLIAEPIAALAQLDIAVPPATTMVARENTHSALHLVTCGRPQALPGSALSDIRDFAELYRDPRLWSLNWIGRDPVATGRMVADPLGELAKIGIHPPAGLSISLLVNTPTLIHLILPPLPPSELRTPLLFERLSAGQAPAALRLGRLFGAGPYNTLIAALSGSGRTSWGGPNA